MSNEPTPNRRRRLTADELIAILIALTGMGSIFFWILGQKTTPFTWGNWQAQTNNSQHNAAKISSAIGGGRFGIGAEGANVGQLNPLAKFNQNAAGGNSNSGQPGVTAPIDPHARDFDLKFDPKPPAAAAGAAIAGGAAVAGNAEATPSQSAAPAVPSSPAPSFNDVQSNFWGADEIKAVGELGILNDFAKDKEGKFDPNQPITRGEYAQILSRAFEGRREVATAPSFPDVSATDPRKAQIDRAVRLGFMKGYSKPNETPSFRPDEKIPRYQMQVSLAQGLGLSPTGDAEATLKAFGDNGKMPSWARRQVAAAIQSGLVIKDDNANQLQPARNASRADAVALIYQQLVREKRINK
jgi:hypothetical protein